MCQGIALAGSDIPTEMEGNTSLRRRAYRRGDLNEFRFLFADPRAVLPILRDGNFYLARWGNGRNQSRYLPRCGWTTIEQIEQGFWRDSDAVRVEIPATFGKESGRWFRIHQGIQGLLVPDERGFAVVYMVMEPASKYYRNMCGGVPHMPALIGQKY